jgi:integral membrane protein (TIGR01906 family)
LDNKLLLTIIRWLVVLAMPFFLGLGTIRLVIAWDYPGFEYRRILPDQFGFTPEERLSLAHGTLEYLRRPEPAEEVIFMLEELRLPGSDEPLYNEREISHMLDVKLVADAMKRIVWITGLIVVIGLTFLLLRPETRLFGWRTLMYGGLATVIALAALAVFILIAWNTFFVQFHQLLFPAGTWTFAYTDSLIRLFPEQFWFDIGVIVTVGTLLQGIAVTLVGYVLSRSG